MNKYTFINSEGEEHCVVCHSQGNGCNHPLTKKHPMCKYCNGELNEFIQNAERKIVSGIGMLRGQEIYHLIENGQFRSIDLCNFDYALLEAYHLSLIGIKNEKEKRETDTT